MNEDALSNELQYILSGVFQLLREKLTISYHQEFGTYEKVLSINHNNLSICRLRVEDFYMVDYVTFATMDKCSELLAGMLIHTLLIRHQRNAPQIENKDD